MLVPTKTLLSSKHKPRWLSRHLVAGTLKSHLTVSSVRNITLPSGTQSTTIHIDEISLPETFTPPSRSH